MAVRIAVEKEDCLGCGLCEERAPNNVEVPPGAGYSRVKKQPVDADEEDACNRAVDYCPTGSIFRVSPLTADSDSLVEAEVLTPVTLAAGSS